MSGAVGALWHGKAFDCATGTLKNEWCGGIRAIEARVYYGPSWKDGREAIIMRIRLGALLAAALTLFGVAEARAGLGGLGGGCTSCAPAAGDA